MRLKLRFKPVSFSWVALHPQPRGVIQFIGGAFFGTFGPMFFYRYLLESLFNRGYTIIILPFNFTFDHYTEAGFLIKEQYRIIPELVRMAKLAGYNYEIYQDNSNFAWIGHSIGCKYIALLEAFSSFPEEPDAIKQIIREVIQEASGSLSPEKQEKKVQIVFNDIEYLINELRRKNIKTQNLISYYVNPQDSIAQDKTDNSDVSIGSLFIKSQPSLLLAPVNTKLDSAIKPKLLANFLISLGVDIKPTPEETFVLMEKSRLFNLLGLVYFKSDNIGKSTREWFLDTFKKPPQDFRAELKGGHLRSLGFRLGNFVINFPDSFSILPIQSVKNRNADFEFHVTQLLNYLEEKRQEKQKSNKEFIEQVKLELV
ncbi:hypothetical protein NIES37_20210 [Tolypothrix tenuis PCC 7101]|uniref:DUF1350 domain-containing protein n=1 Tax=Tolypothrix tenuis PCC 7101 TaxID=231146 RepID=A0A1Z4MX94_9CYAN|nr:DUF1350 family protein [Aulosira sp. FACHB-113]BAY98073.1 hypothetical protein NIES37_20210 [Tolypothrix tenuis PCC 7101]BAZ78008.1 hypothetical protein NIES50_66410 [Aulosira laxa NIES-50]